GNWRMCSMTGNLRIAATFVGVVAALGIGSTLLSRSARVKAAGVMAPKFEVDPMWPKPLPNHWVIGATIGVAVDAKDNVWIIHRPGSLEPKEQYVTMKPQAAECCAAAPPVLEFNAAGELVGHWGGASGEGFTWPASNHGIDVDYKGNVWIGGNGRGTGSAAALPKDESK